MTHSAFRKSVLFAVIFSFFVFQSFAADFKVTKIGALDTQDKVYSEWWYMGTSPTLYGTGNPGSNISVKIDDATNTTTVDANGNWSYVTSMTEGDRNIVVTQDSQNISFVLHLGQQMPTGGVASTQTTTSVPVTGFNQLTALAFSVGIILLASYFYISQDSNKKVVFETRMLDETKK